MSAVTVLSFDQRTKFTECAMYCLQMATLYRIVAPADRIVAKSAMVCLQRSRGIEAMAGEQAENVMGRIEDIAKAINVLPGGPGILDVAMLCLKTCYAALTGDADQAREDAKHAASEATSRAGELLGSTTIRSILNDIGELMRAASDEDAALREVREADRQGVPATLRAV